MNYFNLTKGSFKEKRKEFKKLYVAKRMNDSAILCMIFAIFFGIEYLINTYINNESDFLYLVAVGLFLASYFGFVIMYEMLFRDYVNGCVKEK